MINKWKVALTFPRFLRLFTKSSSMYRKIQKDPNIVSEEYRYHWIKKRAKYILWLFNVKLIVHDIENWVDRGCLLVANHQSNIDPAILMHLNDFNKTAPCAFIGKKELAENKRIKKILSLIDVLFLDRQNPRQALQIMNEANELIRIPRAMVIFPEGTRSHGPEMNEFHAGTFKLAQKAHVPIVPISIVNSYKVANKEYTKKGKKYVHVVFHKPLKPDSFLAKKTDYIANIVKGNIQKGLDQYSNVDDHKAYQEYKKSLKQKDK